MELRRRARQIPLVGDAPAGIAAGQAALALGPTAGPMQDWGWMMPYHNAYRRAPQPAG